MAIKEIEPLSGVTQDNMSFYEHERLLVAYPWRRFFARMLDIAIYSIIWSAFLALYFHVNIANHDSIQNFIDTIIAVISMLFFEPLLLRMFGTTFGKWIFGLHLEDLSGGRPSYNAGFIRTFILIGSGLGYYIPIYNIVMLWKSFKRCSENEEQPWDGELAYSINDTKSYRGIVFVLVNIILIGVIALILACAQIPMNRGDITVSEFAENYNTLESYYGIETGYFLDKNGQWMEKPHDETVYLDFMGNSLPVFEYTTKNNYVTGIRFEIEANGSYDWIISSDKEMILAALSYVGAQKEVGIFSNVRSNISKLVSENTFKNFHFTQAGIEVNCNLEYSGYMTAINNMLISQEGAQTQYRIVFSMQKLEN